MENMSEHRWGDRSPWLSPCACLGQHGHASVKDQPSRHVPGHWLSHLSVQHWLRLDSVGLCSPVDVILCSLHLPSWLLFQDGEQRLPQPLPETFGCHCWLS